MATITMCGRYVRTPHLHTHWHSHILAHNIGAFCKFSVRVWLVRVFIRAFYALLRAHKQKETKGPQSVRTHIQINVSRFLCMCALYTKNMYGELRVPTTAQWHKFTT